MTPDGWHRSSRSTNNANCVDLRWVRASFSGTQVSDNCVELAWRKSTRSGSAGGNCVELARDACQTSPATLYVRDSKNARGPHLRLPSAALEALTGYATREA